MAESFAVKKNVGATILAFATNIALVFVTYRLIIQQSGLDALGLWSTLLAWVFIIRLGDAGMATAALRYVAKCNTAKEGRQIRVYVDSAIVLNGALLIPLAAVGLVGLSWNIDKIVPSGDPGLRSVANALLPLMLAGFVVQNVSGLVLGALRGIHLGYIAAWLTILGTSLQLVAVIVLVPSHGLVGLAWGQLIQHMVVTVMGWLLFRRRLRLSSGVGGPLLPVWVKSSAIREMFGFSVKAQFANLANGFFEPLAKILIGSLAGLEILGLFEIAYKLVALPRNAAVSGIQATVPAVTRLMTSDMPKARKMHAKSMRFVLFVGAFLGLGSTLGSPVASWFLLQRFEATLSIFVFLIACGFFVNTLGAPAFILGMASGRMSNNIASGVLSMVVMAALCYSASFASSADWPLVGSTAIGLAAGGLFIRWRNEKFLAVE